MDEAAVFAEWEEELRDDPTAIVHSILCEVTEAICAAMDEQGMSRADLARKLDVSPQYITEFLNTPQNTTVKQIVRFANAVGLELDLTLRVRDDAKGQEEAATP